MIPGNSPTVLDRGRRAVLSLMVTMALGACLPATSAAAKSSFPLGFSDFAEQDGATEWLDRTVEVGGRIARINAYWRDIAPARPATPSDPRDPAYQWGPLDSVVRAASSRGLDLMVTVYNAPEWAQGADRPGGVPFETWRPDAAAFGEFGRALATRYAGDFDPDGAGSATPLPAVGYLQAWNEPNLGFYLNPQYDGTSPRSPGIYRGLLNAFYDGAHAGNPDVRVLVGGTAPYGEDPGGERMRPLAFWREVFCLEGRRRMAPTQCAEKARFDVFAHHPINTTGDPGKEARHPDDASTADLGDLTKVLRAAERKGTVGGPAKHPVWADEIWIESNPPDERLGVPQLLQARWIEKSLYLLWKQSAKAVILLQAIDPPEGSGDPVQAGVFFADGAPKTSAVAVRFPFVTDRISRRKVLAWGMAPGPGDVEVQRKKGGWKTVAKLGGLEEGEVFKRKLKLRGDAELRAISGDLRSVVWAQE